MTTDNQMSREEVKAALATLDQLSREEYGLTLSEALLDDSPDAPLRIQRLTGIVLKRPFAEESKRPGDSRTQARHSWPWSETSPEVVAEKAPKEFQLLKELRMPGPWNERKPLDGTPEDAVPITWDELKHDADTERGLFKILVLYVDDKMKGRGRRTLREYLEAEESLNFKTGLDLAAVVADAAVLGPVYALIGLPAVAVGVALVGIQHGYRRLTDPNADRVGDISS